MIKNLWYAVLESKEVKKGKITSAKRMGLNLVFWRKENGEFTFRFPNDLYNIKSREAKEKIFAEFIIFFQQPLY